MRLGPVGRRRLLVVGSALLVVGVLRWGPALEGVDPPRLAPPEQLAADRPVPAVSTMPLETTASVPPTANALGLVSRGEFVVYPQATLVTSGAPFVAVPEDTAGRYAFGMSPEGGGRFAPVRPEDRCLRPELASAVQHLALRFASLFGPDGVHLVIGEGNSAGDHVTHYGGAYVDLYTNLGNARSERFLERDGDADAYVARLPLARNFLRVGGELSYEESVALWLLMAVVDSGQFSRVVFESDKVDDLAEGYAALRGVPFAADPIRWSGNRTHHYHLHLEAEPAGESRACTA